MACPACASDNPAGARFCAECGATLGAAAACPRCGEPTRPAQKFCNACGQSLGTAAPVARDPRAYTPPHLAEKILATRAALEGERKHVTVLFADVKGSMELAEQLDPEAWHGIMDRFLQLLAEGVHRFEGTVNQYTGDGIMALFGAPIAHEDHARRAGLAALHLRDEVRRYAHEIRRGHGVDFGVRIGLNSGEVVVGRIGDDLRMDYTALGHTVGLAQRVEQLAEPGRPYLTEATAALVRGYLALEDLGEFRLKGASAPLRVHALDGVGALRTRLDASRARGFSRFVGRADETAALEAALERALAGQGQVVGVVADAGTGKSRLCWELAERCRARGIMVREAHGVPHGKMLPFLPVLELIRGYFEIGEQDSAQVTRHKIAGALLLLDRRLEDALPLLFDFLGVPDPERRPEPGEPAEARQQRLLAVVRRVIEARSARQPALLLIEDLHWIDAGTEAFLESMVEAVARTRTLLLVNFRPEYHARWMQRAHYRQLPLLPLGPEATGELLVDLLGTDPSLATLTARIRERTAGNPFFVEEVVQALVEAGDLAGARGAYHLARPVDEVAIPPSVHGVLAARIDRLGEREKGVLYAAAVIGKEVAEPVLGHVVTLPTTELADALRALTRAEFLYEEALYPEAVYAFKHPLTAEVAYGAQLADRRAHIHAAVARALEERAPGREGEQAALLAHHWEGAHEPLAAARWHRRAAEWSGLANVAQTFHHWSRVRALVRDLEPSPGRDELATVAGLRMLFGGARVGAPEAEMTALFTEVAEGARRSGSEAALAEARTVYEGYRLATTGCVNETLPGLEEAHAVLARCGDVGARLASHYHLAVAYSAATRLGDWLEVVEDGHRLSAAENYQGFETGLPHSFLYLKGVALLRLGRLRESEAAIDELMQVAGGTPSPVVQLLLEHAQTLRASGRGDAAAEVAHAIRALDLAERLGLGTSISMSYFLLGTARCDEGSWAEASAVLERALGLQRARFFRMFEVTTLAALARARLELGDPGLARTTADEALAIAVERGLWMGAPEAYVVRARARLREADPPPLAAVEADLAAADALVARTNARFLAPAVLLARAEVAAHLGDDAGRVRHLREAARLWREMGGLGWAERIEAAI